MSIVFKEYRDYLISLVDTNVSQKLKITFNPAARWNNVSVSPSPDYNKCSQPDVFLFEYVHTNVYLTERQGKTLQVVSVYCEVEQLFNICMSKIRMFYREQCGFKKQKLSNDPVYTWLDTSAGYRGYSTTSSIHKEILNLAKYIDAATKQGLPADHKKNILALIVLLREKHINGTK